MTTTLRTRNITKVFRLASAEQLAFGIEWYERARRLAVELEPADPRKAAAVIAVLSPRLAWSINVRLARQAYAMWAANPDSGHENVLALGKALPCLDRNGVKAFLILAGSDPDSVVGGPKVRAFWHTIADPTDPRAVVVDRHAFDVAAGRVTDDATRGATLGRRGGYDGLCDLYRRAAVILSRETGTVISPAMVQAVTWTVWRENFTARSASAALDRAA